MRVREDIVKKYNRNKSSCKRRGWYSASVLLNKMEAANRKLPDDEYNELLYEVLTTLIYGMYKRR